MTPDADSTSPDLTIGTAKMVLVSDVAASPRAVMSCIIAKALPRGRRPSVSCAGPGMFTRATSEHIRRVIVPLVEQITTSLGLARHRFELSAANVDAASAADIGTSISGYSADVPVFLAMLSAASGLALPQDVVATGHIASAGGDIALVKGLPQKIAAAMADASIRRFIYPDLNRDGSLEALSPKGLAAAEAALASAQDKLHMTAITDIAQLVQSILLDEALVLASLEQGFFGIASLPAEQSGAVGKTVRLLADGSEARFWACLQHRLFAGRLEPPQRLLETRIAHHIRKNAYPSGFGLELLRLLRSIPPTIWRLQLGHSPISTSQALKLAALAGTSDQEDVQHLLRAAMDGAASYSVPAGNTPISVDATEMVSLDVLLSEMDAAAQRAAAPIDRARASYCLPSVVAQSHAEFMDTIASFYLHVLRHLDSVAPAVNPQRVGADALALLTRAFANRGGADGAWAEARDAVHGGLRLILDLMTEQLKREEQAKDVNRVLKEALGGKEWLQRVQMMAVLMQRLAPHLPPEIRDQPASHYTRHLDEIVRAYVSSMSQVKEVLRIL